MGMGGFAEGAANGLKTYLSNQQNQQDMAFKLKLQNAQIEGQLANEKEMADYNRASETATKDMSGGAETGRANTKTQEWYQSKERNKTQLLKPRGGVGARYDKADLVASILKDPRGWDNLTKTVQAEIFPDLQRGGFKLRDRPLPGDLQVRADNAKSGLDAIARVNLKIKTGGNDFAQLYAPGAIGARELRTDMAEIVEVIKRIRTGAASNGREDEEQAAQVMQNGMANLLEDVMDGQLDPAQINYSLNTVYYPYLERMANMQERRRTADVVDAKLEADKKAAAGFNGMNSDEKLELLIKRRAAKKEAAEKAAKEAAKSKGAAGSN